MTRPQDALGLLRQLRDLPIVDVDGRWCGVCDDIEFDGEPGGPLHVANLLVGVGGWRGRGPRWLIGPLQALFGDQAARVPWSAVRSVGPQILLHGRGEAFGLRRVEDRLARRMPRLPAW
jgi:sporulation protein YlmC with PRC-barrel domain